MRLPQIAIVSLISTAAFLGALAFQKTGEYYDGGKGVALPDPRVTPGAIDPSVKQENVQKTICQPNYTAKVRHVTEATKLAVFEEYGIDPKDSAQYEVDHLISLEIGGSNNIKNLWPQPYEPKPGARQKDALENALHRAVCSGEITLKESQAEISHNWYIAYQARVSEK